MFDRIQIVAAQKARGRETGECRRQIFLVAHQHRGNLPPAAWNGRPGDPERIFPNQETMVVVEAARAHSQLPQAPHGACAAGSPKY